MAQPVRLDTPDKFCLVQSGESWHLRQTYYESNGHDGGVDTLQITWEEGTEIIR